MKENVITFIVMLLLVLLAYTLAEDDKGRVVMYDCRLAEISPDYPQDVREACRAVNAKSEIGRAHV